MNLADVCSCACHSVNIQQQESHAIARKLHDAAGVLGFTFADVIHYRHKVTSVGLTSKDSKDVTSCDFAIFNSHTCLDIALSTAFMSE